MKFYIRQQPLTWRERFTIRDEKEQDVLAAEGELFSQSATLHLSDMSGRKIGLINQQLLGWQPRYRVEINGRQSGFVVRRFALVGSRFDFDGLGWMTDGTIGSHDFNVYSQERIVMTVRKASLSWGDSFELDIKVRDEILPAVCMLLAVNMALALDSN